MEENKKVEKKHTEEASFQKEYSPLVIAISLLGLLAGFFFGRFSSEATLLFSIITALIAAIFSLLGIKIELKSGMTILSVNLPNVITQGFSIGAFCLGLAFGYCTGNKELLRNGFSSPCTTNEWVKSWQKENNTDLGLWIDKVEKLKGLGYSDKEINALSQRYFKSEKKP